MKNCGKKIRDLIRSITKNSDDYDEKYMKMKLNSDVELLLNKTIEIPTITIVVRAIFLENKFKWFSLFFGIRIGSSGEYYSKSLGKDKFEYKIRSSSYHIEKKH